MTELEILQQRFSDMAQQFPGLTHILTIWPKNEKEPRLNPKYMPAQDNLLTIWGDGLVREYIPERNMKHWLIKPRYASWNKDHASENFRDLAEKAGRVLTEKGFLSRLKLPEHILKLSEYKFINRHVVQLWVLVVHELGNTKRYVTKSSDIKASILHDIIPDKFGKKPPSAYYEVQKDVFLDSSLVICKLLEKDSRSLLSDRQLEVWNLLKGKALSAKELGKLLDLSAENIRKHIEAIRKKFGQEAIESTRSRGYWRPDDPPPDGVNQT